MSRLAFVAAAVLLLGGCVSSEPKVALADQVGAEQRQAMEAASEGGGGGEGGGDGGGGGGGGGGDASTLTFVAVDIDFEQAPDTAAAGELTITLNNEGAAVHNVAFETVQNGEPVVEAAGGESAEATVTLESGDYTYFCSVPGHREAGMEGQLTVEG